MDNIGYKNIKKNSAKLKSLLDNNDFKSYRKKELQKQKYKQTFWKIKTFNDSSAGVSLLLWSNIIVYLLYFIPGFQSFLITNLALYPLFSANFVVYQIFTTMFLHGGFIHLLFNMLTLWSFGNALEKLWGTKKFLIFYILCGLGSSVLYTTTGTMPAVGASGAICGIFAAFTLLYPEQRVSLMFFIPLKIKTAFLFLVGVSIIFGILGLFNPSMTGGIAHFAHLGGIITGYLLFKYGQKWYYNRTPIEQFTTPR